MSKVISLITPKGTIGIPLRMIAENRAEYYAEVDGYSKYSNEWQEEVDFVMENNFEGIDWFMNNMDLEEVIQSAVMINPDVYCASYEEYDQDEIKIIDV